MGRLRVCQMLGPDVNSVSNCLAIPNCNTNLVKEAVKIDMQDSTAAFFEKDVFSVSIAEPARCQ